MAISLLNMATAALAGLLSHIFFFRKGEHHLFAFRYVGVFIGVLTSSLFFLAYDRNFQPKEAATITGSLAAFYLIGLYSSLITYRVFFHPLNQFPGPLGARISGFWLSAHLLEKTDACKQIQKLHERYGPFVRVGPSDLSIAHEQAVNVIYGPGSKCTKAAWYDLTLPIVSLQTLRSKVLHNGRRRIWSAVFGDKALRGYEQRIRVHRQKFMNQIAVAVSRGQPVNVTKWFNLYSFDVMGDLAFGRSFDMITTGEHQAIKLLNNGLHTLAYYFPVWFFRFLTAIPGLSKDWWTFMEFCSQRLDERMKAKVDIPDISSALIGPRLGRSLDTQERALLIGDTQLIVVAGSDTTASTLSSVIYYLTRQPQEKEKLFRELEPYLTDPSGEVLHAKIADLDHLNGIINEALRLHPPVPTAIQRKTPPEGVEIDGRYIPGNMTVYSPQYVLGRSEAIYPHADKFIPERWYKYSGMVKDKSAFSPFLTGPYNCIGKPLALLNLRTTLACLIARFDWDFAPGEDGTAFTVQAVDRWILSLGDLNISFVARQRS